jgi:hypothetical protein
MTESKSVLNTMPTPKNPPFWYGSFSALWVYFPVPISVLDDILGTQSASLKAFKFDDLSKDGQDMGLMNINFMTYSSDSGVNDPQSYYDITKTINYGDDAPAGMGVEPTHECEINIVSYSDAKSAQTPFGLSSSGFIRGHDHTKTIGNYRLWVPCDDRIAVYWGMHNFGENKLMTYPFTYQNPSLNNPTCTTWNFTIPASMSESSANTLFSLEIDDLEGRTGVVSSNQSEIIDFSLYPHSESKPTPTQQRLVASRRNIFGAFKCMTNDSGGTMPTCKFSNGDSAHAVVADLGKMLGTGQMLQPAGVMTFFTAPVIAESSLYYADI